MTGLLVFGILLVLGFVTLVVVKVRWARQSNRKMSALMAAAVDPPK